MRDNFIPTIVNFNTDDISDEVRIQMKKEVPRQPGLRLREGELHYINQIKSNQ